MNLDAIRARLGSIGPRALDNLPGSVRRLIEDDMPKLIVLAERIQIGHEYDCEACPLCDAIEAINGRRPEELPAAARAGS